MVQVQGKTLILNLTQNQVLRSFIKYFFRDVFEWHVCLLNISGVPLCRRAALPSETIKNTSVSLGVSQGVTILISINTNCLILAQSHVNCPTAGKLPKYAGVTSAKVNGGSSLGSEGGFPLKTSILVEESEALKSGNHSHLSRSYRTSSYCSLHPGSCASGWRAGQLLHV